MELTLNGKYIMMWTCWGCGYVEVFGLDSDEQSKLIDWYDQLVIDYKAKE
jgi:predicted nucleic-acid-binding Zn-ribbon protein